MSTLFSGGKYFVKGSFLPLPLKSYRQDDYTVASFPPRPEVTGWTQLFTRPPHCIFILVSCFFSASILLTVLSDCFGAVRSRLLSPQKPSLVANYLPHKFCLLDVLWAGSILPSWPLVWFHLAQSLCSHAITVQGSNVAALIFYLDH